MKYAVYQILKCSGSGRELGKIIDRTAGTDQLKNINPEYSQFNKSYNITKYCEMPLETGIKERIKIGYKAKKAIRKTAITHLSLVLSCSQKSMFKIIDENNIEKWIKQNYQFICDNYGKENIIRFTLHADEITPHLHVVTVPLTTDGRLSAKEIVGNRQKLQKLQDVYADYMSEFDLERGVKGSKANQKSIKRFYARINEATELIITKIAIPEFTNIPEKKLTKSNTVWTEELKQAVYNFTDGLLSKQVKIDSNLLEMGCFKTANEKIKEDNYKRLKNEINALNKELKASNERLEELKTEAQYQLDEVNKDKTKALDLYQAQKGMTSKANEDKRKLEELLIFVAKGDATKQDIERYLSVNDIYKMGRR